MDPVEEQLRSLNHGDPADPVAEPWRGERAAVVLAAAALAGCVAVWIWLLVL